VNKLNDVTSKRRFISWLSLLSLLLIIIFAAILNQKTKQNEEVRFQTGVHGILETFPFNKAVEKADLIAKVIIHSKLGEVKQYPLSKTMFAAEVVEVLKEPTAVPIENHLVILQHGNAQTSFNNNSLFQPDETYILFLMKATTGNNQYWILGEETNMYKIYNEHIIKQSLKDNQLAGIEDTTIQKEELSKYVSDKQIQVLSLEGFVRLIKNELNQK